MFQSPKRVALPLVAAKRLLSTHALRQGVTYPKTFLYDPKLKLSDLENEDGAVKVASRLALDATERANPDGSTTWANPEGHWFLDQFFSLGEEAKSQRGTLFALEARLASIEKQHERNAMKVVILESELLARNRELETVKNEARIGKSLGIALRLPFLATYLKTNHHRLWCVLGGSYEDELDPDTVVAVAGNLALDVALFRCGAMKAVHKEAFAQLYGVDVTRAGVFLEYPRISECFDKFATLMSRGKDCEPLRRRFLAEVGRANAEGDDACSEALQFLRGELPNRQPHV